MFHAEMKIQRTTYPAKRKCKECKKPLSIYNPHSTCFRHTPIYVKDIDNNERIFWRILDEDPPVDPKTSVCTSRSTPAFEAVQAEYQGLNPEED